MKTYIKISAVLIFLSVLIQDKIMFSQELSIQTGHSTTITDIEFCGNNEYIISSGADNKIIIWDMNSFMQMKLIVGHEQVVNAIAIHPNEKKFASCSDDGKIIIWTYPEGDIIKSFETDMPVKDIAFSPDGNKLAYVSKSVYIIDLLTNNETTLNYTAKKYFTTVDFSDDGSFLAFGGKREKHFYIYNLIYNEELSKFKLKTNSLIFSGKENHIIAAGDNGVIKKRQINSKSDKKITLQANNFWDAFNDVQTTDKYIISANRDNLIYVYDKNTGKRISILEAHTKEPTCVTVSTDGKYAASAGKDRKIIIWNLDKFTETKTIQGGANSITSLSFSKDGNYMFLTYNDGSNRIWNLSNKGQMLYKETPERTFLQKYYSYEYSSQNSFYEINPNKIFLIYNLNKIDRKNDNIKNISQKVHIWNIQDLGKSIKIKNKKKNTYRQFFVSDTLNLMQVNYNATHLQEYSLLNHEKILDRQKVYSADFYLYSTSSAQIFEKKKIKTDKLPLKTTFSIEGDVYFSNISPDGEFLIAFNVTQYNRVCDLWDLTIQQKITSILLDRDYETGGFSPNSKYFYLVSEKDTIIKLYETSTQNLIDSFIGKSPLDFSDTETLIAFIDNDRNLILYNLKEKKQIFKINTQHQTEISDLNFNSPYNYIATVGYDGLIKFWNIETGEAIVSLAAFDNNDFIYVAPNNYYYSTKGAMKYISFIHEKNLYTFDQFDIKFNRPDTVLSRLTYTSPEEIEIYRKAYKKRLTKMGFSNISDVKINIPVVNIDNINEIPISTEDKTLDLKISAYDKSFNLDRINVWVNSVPVYGTNGKSIRHLHEKEYSDSIEITLSNGHNKIDFTAINEQGLESLKKSFSIVCENEVSSDLYIISIGISKYLDTTLNLDYAEKDANDIINLFSSKNKAFSNIIPIKLTNEQATRENILALKNELLKTKVDDQVILFFAGHGLLDEDYNYFLTTYTFDYYNFFNSIVGYDEFVDLLDSIPARRKIVFIDACHSGEIDEDTQDDNQTGAVIINDEAKSYGERSLWNIQTGEIPKFGSQSSLEIMKMMFADLRRGSGTTIISSAGGQEYAYESKKIQNGVFTYVLINGLMSKKADSNKDGKVMISELQVYVMKTVSELTKGKQNPTNRRENLNYDFIIWQ